MMANMTLTWRRTTTLHSKRFIPIVNDLLEALKSRFTAAGNIEHLNWIGFLNLRSWPVKDWSGISSFPITTY
jgi:hypothetical protein